MEDLLWNGDFFKIGIPFILSAIVPAYILIWILFGVSVESMPRMGWSAWRN